MNIRMIISITFLAVFIMTILFSIFVQKIHEVLKY